MTWLVNGQLLDVRSGRSERKHIRTDNGRVSAISAERPVKADDTVVDLAGAYVLPGFFDCHVHICVNTRNPNVADGWGGALPGTIALYAADSARRLLMAGITTARDVGGWDYHEIAVREAIRAGWIPGPRLYCAGRILTITSSSTPYWRGMYEEADGPAAVRRAARQQLARGADFIKLLATGAVTSTAYENPHAVQYRGDEIRAAVEIANDNFTYVAAHAHAPAGIRNAAEAGCRSVEHTVYGDEGAYRVMAERGTYLVPTLCITQAMFADPALAAAVPDHIRHRYRELHDLHVANIALARRLGVRIAMGTDAGTPGNHCGDNMQELEVMVREAGFSALEAIQAATIGAATMMRLDDDLGTLEPGKLADLIVIKDNPVDDVGALRSVSFVMKGGQIVKRDGREVMREPSACTGSPNPQRGS
jgi:imidazolonepropionase-like amidohydrolase